MSKFANSRSLSAVTALFAITAFILMWVGSIRCNFIKFPVTSGNTGGADMELGLWYYQFISFMISSGGTYAFESCNTYPDGVTVDGSWRSARAFSVIAFVFGIIMLITACVSVCSAQKREAVTYAWMAPGYLLTALCQGLTLLMLGSSSCNSDVLLQLPINFQVMNITFADTCSMSTGAKLSTSAMSLWFAAAVASFMAHKAEKEGVSEGHTDAGLDEPLFTEDA